MRRSPYPTPVRVALGALTAAGLVAAPPAEAQLPDAYGSFNTDVSTTVTAFPASASLACGTASIAAAPLPTLTARGTDCPYVLQAIFIYSFRIAGPDALVPVVVASTHALAATGAAQAGYSLTVAGQTIDIGNCYFGSLTACGSRTSTTTMSLMANQTYGVAMMTDVSNSLGAGSGDAFLDPQFFLDPVFVGADDYTFLFSPGVGNGVATVVPEPGAAPMLVLGLAAYAAARRRKTRSTPSA